MKTADVVDRGLPDPEERRRIREQASLILRQARALRERLDQDEREFLALPTPPMSWGVTGYESQVSMEHY